MTIDLSCVEDGGVKTLSCEIVDEPDAADRTLGPVPYVNGVVVLAEMLYGALPGRFVDLRGAKNLLTEVHMRNLVRYENAAGTSYPRRTGARP